MLVFDLVPFIKGQLTQWTQLIRVEKKVVVTLFKLTHDCSMTLVADKAAIGRSTVYNILQLVYPTLCAHFEHLIAWHAE